MTILFFSFLFLSFFKRTESFIQINHRFAERKLNSKISIKMHDENQITTVLRNRFTLQNIPYNKLLDRIQNKEISKIYFSNKYNEVISESKIESEDVYSDFVVTDIIPQLTNDLIDISVKNKVEPVFKIKLEQPTQIQTIAYDT